MPTEDGYETWEEYDERLKKHIHYLLESGFYDPAIKKENKKNDKDGKHLVVSKNGKTRWVKSEPNPTVLHNSIWR